MFNINKSVFWKQLFHRSVIIVDCCVLVAIFSIVIVGMMIHSASFPPLLGNHDNVISKIQTDTNPDDFTFIALGDIKGGMATFEALMDIAKEDHPDFGVILGDFVSQPELSSHKLFALEIDEEHIPFPLLLVPGNHDLCPDGPFTLDDFKNTWGPDQFNFALGPNLFIFLNNAEPYDADLHYLQYFEQILSQKASGYRDIFVFMHEPPVGLNDWILSRNLHGSQKFMQLAQKYNIRYVFTGDHHGYVKTEKDGTTYIVTGGGGARLRGSHGHFFHLTRMAVHDGKITETVISVGKHLETFELMERNIATYLFPLLTQNYFVLGGTILLVFLIFFSLVFSSNRLKHLRRLSSEPALDKDSTVSADMPLEHLDSDIQLDTKGTRILFAFAHSRVMISRLFSLILIFLIIFTAHSWNQHSLIDLCFEVIGLFLISICCLGRMWALVYISGYKSSHLVTQGPYSIVRHPLYFFSLIGCIGIGFASENLLIMAAIILFYFFYYPLTILAEEKKLLFRFGNTYLDYMKKTPRFIPKWSLLNEMEFYKVNPEKYFHSFIDGMWFIWIYILIHFIESLQEMGIIPILFKIP